jgi:hypothetical protein
MNNKSNFISFLRKYWWLLLFILLFPYIIAIIYYFPDFPFHQKYLDLSYKEWLNFWSIFIGSSIGGLTALYAIHSSTSQNEKFHIDQLEYQKEIERKKKSDAIPIFDFNSILDPFIDTNKHEAIVVKYSSINKPVSQKTIISINKISQFGIDIQEKPLNDDEVSIVKIFTCINIGLAPAINTTIFINENKIYPSISFGKEKKIIFVFVFNKELKSFREIPLTIFYKDIYNFYYKQSMWFTFNSENFIFKYQQLSSPIEINKEEYNKFMLQNKKE